MTREALKKLNEKQMNYCKTLSALIDRAKIKGLKEENERNRGKLRGLSLSAEYNTAPQVSETDTNSTESGV